MNVTELLKNSVEGGEVQSTVKGYVERFREQDEASVNERLKNASKLTQEYYSLVTDFYLNAWGRMFHFGARRKGQSFRDSLLQHELFLANKLQLREGEKCLDIGCGVGGPMLNIVRKTKAHVTGINNSAYQIGKAKQFVKKEKLEEGCSFMECDWMKIPLSDRSFDKAYTVEASCHAADRRVELFREIYRLLKPGALFAGYEWTLTENFDLGNPAHQEIKYGITVGNALSNLNMPNDVLRALKQSGFEMLECYDRAADCDPETPWYLPLKGEGSSLQLIRMSPAGRLIMRNAMRALEAIRILPKGTMEVSKLLHLAGKSLVKGGEEKIFTPMLFFLSRKP